MTLTCWLHMKAWASHTIVVNLQDSKLWLVLLSNGTIAFGLNLSVFLLIGKTSALTMNVAGVIKDWLLIGLSVLIFQAKVESSHVRGTSHMPPALCV